MDYPKLFKLVSDLCKDERSYIILGILQSIRDDCPIDDTTINEMLNLIYNQRKLRTKNYTPYSTKIDTPKSTNDIFMQN